MSTAFKQLIIGNPGTSYVVALLALLHQKYGYDIQNQAQMEIFTAGVVNSRQVFFSGVLNALAAKYQIRVQVLTDSEVLLVRAVGELSSQIKIALNPLGLSEILSLLDRQGALVLAVDLFSLAGYHDYHFVLLQKSNATTYRLFEPKSGESKNISRTELESLATSVRAGLKDVSLAFYPIIAEKPIQKQGHEQD
jgi:hypothetical protein